MRAEEFFATADPSFEESIRIDRQVDTTDEAERREKLYRRYLDTYHLTEASATFLKEFVEHVQRTDGDTAGLNHWLYGYYGSGKSHLLTTLRLLVDTETLADADCEAVWNRFDEEGYGAVEKRWQAMHNEFLVVPLSINLLRYQSVREQSFSEIILQTVYRDRGFSDRLDVAFFEEEFQQEGGLFDTREVWDRRVELTNDLLREAGVDDPDYDWSDVEQYRILSDLVLEGLTGEATGMTENLADIQNRSIGQEYAVAKIEEFRHELAEQHDRPAEEVKIVLLMDEVTLFIGGDYQRLSELNALAESVEKVGQGNILTVVTAQSQIEDVRPGLATKQLDFGILKDRFPRQHHLPSHHVGEIVQQRLLEKDPYGRRWVETEALTASVHPPSMLVYSDVGQNTSPPLNTIESDVFIDYYPLLPYQPALFLEILSNLRNELADATKSIFSGTARAILALVAGLRNRWLDEKDDMSVISLVDFYDLIRYELDDIIPGKTEVIRDIEADTNTTGFDVRVAKAVLLLSYVPDVVGQEDANLAVAVMDDLDGEPRFSVSTQVRESLDGNLEKYIRPESSPDGAMYRLTDREEQRLVTSAREYEADPEWEAIIETLGGRLWDRIVDDLELPPTYEYTSEDLDTDNSDDADAVPTGSGYDVGYEFEMDGVPLGSSGMDEAVFSIPVVVRGVDPEQDDDRTEPERLYWESSEEGIDDLRDQLVEWWAIHEATRTTNPPESIVSDRTDAADRVVNKLVAALKRGSFTVEAQDTSRFDVALDACIDSAYPSHFDPRLFEIDESHLDELRRLGDDEELRQGWATAIGIPTQPDTDAATIGDLALQVRKVVGTALQDANDQLDVATVLDRVTEKDGLFGEVQPAVLAFIWGLCRVGVFRVMTVDGEAAPIDDILSESKHTERVLSIVPPSTGDRPKDIFVEYDLIKATQTENSGYLALDELERQTARQARSLAEDARVNAESTFQTVQLTTSVGELAADADEKAEAAEARRNDAPTADVETLREIGAAARNAESWLETAQQKWDGRSAFLLQLEGLLRLGGTEVPWLGTSFESTVKTLTEQLEAAAGTAWWESGEWQSFVQSLDARDEAVEALATAWGSQRQAVNIDSLLAELEGHSWLISTMDLPTAAVNDGFRQQYLDPLRTFRKTAARIQNCIEPLTSSAPTSNDGGTLTEALGILDSEVDWTILSQEAVERRRELLNSLDSVVDNRTPDDVRSIGVLQADSAALRASFDRIADDDDLPELVEVEGGVLIR